MGKKCPEVIVPEVFPTYEEAQTLYDEMSRLAEYKKRILTMNNRYFSVLRSYKKPPPVIVHVIKACYLLFGYSASEVSNYSKLTRLMQKLGKESFKRRVMTFEPSARQVSQAQNAKQWLDRYTENDVKA